MNASPKTDLHLSIPPYFITISNQSFNIINRNRSIGSWLQTSWALREITRYSTVPIILAFKMILIRIDWRCQPSREIFPQLQPESLLYLSLLGEKLKLNLAQGEQTRNHPRKSLSNSAPNRTQLRMGFLHLGRIRLRTDCSLSSVSCIDRVNGIIDIGESFRAGGQTGMPLLGKLAKWLLQVGLLLRRVGSGFGNSGNLEELLLIGANPCCD